MKAVVNDDKMTLLYKLEPGVSEKSFGIDVARIAHFPETVIEEARQRMAKLEGGQMNVQEDIFLSRLKDLENVDDKDLVNKFIEIKNDLIMI